MTTPALSEKKGDWVACPGKDRFETSRMTLWVDRWMTLFVRLGGIGIIAAVLSIFVLIFLEILPLFKDAEVREMFSVSLPQGSYRILGIDEWGERPFWVTGDYQICFWDYRQKKVTAVYSAEEKLHVKISAVHYDSRRQTLIFGTEDGRFAMAKLTFQDSNQNSIRKVREHIEWSSLEGIGKPGVAIELITMGESQGKRLVAALQKIDGQRQVVILRMEREHSLSGTSDFAVMGSWETVSIAGVPRTVLVNSDAEGLIVSTQIGELFYFSEKDGHLVLKQRWMPFENAPEKTIASIHYLLGEMSLVLTNPQGINQMDSLFIPKGANERLFGMTKEFSPIPEGIPFYDAGSRNKAFLIGAGRYASVRYATTEAIRWERTFPFEIKKGILGPKYDRIFLLDSGNQLHIFSLKDPHPEAGWKAFFGKIWYEGYSEPGYFWQSSGSTDDFEPKLSLIPLMFGTLKGTFYAMFFALPIALLAALYTSQFAHPGFRSMIKPAMEMMASLPSVVLGFMAALWLAPLIETKIPSLLMILLFIPVFAVGFGSFWTRIPLELRKWIRPGYEWIAVLPVLAAAAALGWQTGPWIEKLFFVFTDPATGERIADFRLWWPQVTGASFEQRNSLVVGFGMAFAVIPVIFTIAEDSLSNVPKSLSSGSLALGASRWQTALNVVAPTAFPGIFSGIMIGLGRAVGETMIVVMATGNTPVMNWNVFSGMRTLSANIAVELPEAPHLGTLYRTLFLGAMILFVMTFAVNTAAEVIRQHLRERYKTV